jgi:hypothetical protein
MLTQDEGKQFDILLNKIYKIQEKENISQKDYDLYLEYSREIEPLMDKAPEEIQKQFLWTNEGFYIKAKILPV